MTRERATELLKGFQLCCDFAECNNAWDCEECVDALNTAIEALEQEPIIRCEDCKYAKPFLHRYHCKQLDEDWEINFGAEHYCSFAERLESDKE